MLLLLWSRLSAIGGGAADELSEMKSWVASMNSVMMDRWLSTRGSSLSDSWRNRERIVDAS